METKSLLYGLTGFFIGGLLVSIAATTFDKPALDKITNSSSHGKTMNDMSAALKDKSGDAYDKAFLEEMIAHHEGAIEMSKQSAENAQHQELKDLSTTIVDSQEQEIKTMKQWQQNWGYIDATGQDNHSSH